MTRNLNPGFNAKIDSCLNHKNLLPDSLATSLNVSRISDHIQITVNYDGKFDYYGINYNGYYTCYAFRGFTGPLNITTEEAVKECDKFSFFTFKVEPRGHALQSRSDA